MRAFQPDLAAGHRARAQLVLQADDAVVVVAAIGQLARQQEQRHALVARHGVAGLILHAGQHHRQRGIGVGAEPLVAQQAPAALGRSVAHRAGGGGGDVGAGALLGHEHRALVKIVKDLGGQVGQKAPDQRRVAELAQRARQRVGHRQRAAQAELGLHKQICECILSCWRHGLVPAQHAAPVRRRRQAEFGKGHALHLHIGRMLVDALRIDARASAVGEFGGMAVGHAGQFVEHTAGQRTHALQVRQQVVEQVGWQVERQQRAQVRVGGKQAAALAVGYRVGSGRCGGVGLKCGVAHGAGRHGWSPGIGWCRLAAPLTSIIGTPKIRV
ncbi:hypothetical protein D9M72_466690 [compost metagenome]